MKGLFQTVLAAAAISAALAKPLNHRRHQHHHDKRALVIVTETREVVEIEYVYSTVYVAPGEVRVQPTSSASSSVASVASTFSAYVPPPPPPPPPPTTSSTSTSTTSSFVDIAPVVTPEPYTPPVPTTTSSIAPAPTVEAFVPPAPIFDEPAPAPSTSAAPDTTSADSFVGEGTYYDCGLGSCGDTDTNDSYVAAMSRELMLRTEGANPNANPVCGKKIRIFSAMAPEGILLTVKDKCPGCQGPNDVDVCKNVFLKHLGTEAEGRIKIWWKWES